MDEALFPKPLLLGMRSMFAVSGRLFPSRLAQKAADLFLQPERHQRPEREQTAVDAGERLSFHNGMQGFRWKADKPNAPIVMLVHGWSGRATQLFAFIKLLQELGYEVVAVDLPAHGESLGETTTIPHTRDSLIAVGKELGSIHAIIAHSFGSACSMWAIENGMQVKHLVSLGAPTHYMHRVFAQFFHIPAKATELFVDEVSHRMQFPADKVSIQELIDYEGPMANTPTLLVHGSDDREMPLYHAEKNAELLPKSELIVLDNCGHRKVVWDPRVVAKVAEWLGKA